jgi:hypothetical protein
MTLSLYLRQLWSGLHRNIARLAAVADTIANFRACAGELSELRRGDQRWIILRAGEAGVRRDGVAAVSGEPVDLSTLTTTAAKK